MYIGIDLGGTNIAAGLVDKNCKIIHKASVKTYSDRHYTEILKDMAELSLQVTKEAGYSVDDIESIGIGSPGTCDNKNGILVYTNNIPFSNVPMRAEIQKYINKPVYIENDANCAALGEYHAMGKPMECFVAITLGTGVGGGVIINGKIHSGFNGAAGELGHIVIQKDGEPCTCGRLGCWESYASATALIRQTKVAIALNPQSVMNELIEDNLNKVGGRTAFIAAKQGDSAGLTVVKEYIDYISLGISNIINIFQPEMLVIGGGICNEGDYLLNPIKEYVKNNTYKGDVEKTKLGIATLGNDAGIIGAALLGI